MNTDEHDSDSLPARHYFSLCYCNYYINKHGEATRPSWRKILK